jgi:DNA-binding transcriptional ArsR family regulator
MPATAEQSTTGVVDPRSDARQPIDFKAGEWYQTPKDLSLILARLEGLSSDARRVHEFLRPASFGYQQELAVKKTKRGMVPLTPSDIAKSKRDPDRVTDTGLSKQHVRRALRELADAGLCRVEGDHRGQIRIYLFAKPRKAAEGSGSRARLPNDPLPSWIPTTWSPLKPLFKHLKMVLALDEEAARDCFEEGAEIARAFETADKEARAFIKRVGARISLSNKEERTDKEQRERTEQPPEPEPVAPVVAEFVSPSPSSSCEFGTESEQCSVPASAEQVGEPPRAEAPTERPPDPQGAPTQQQALTPPRFDPEPSWNAFWRRYSRGHPNAKDAFEREARAWWQQHVTTRAFAVEIIDGLDRHIASADWADGYGIPSAINFLQKGYFKHHPPPRQRSKREQEEDVLRAYARFRTQQDLKSRGGGG